MNFDIEKSLTINNKYIIGVDEAGRGPLAGIVVASAFVFLDITNDNKIRFLSLINDSKKLSEGKREIIYQMIMDDMKLGNYVYKVASASVEEIDKFNILGATKLAMERAVLQIYQDINNDISENNSHIIVDGNQKMNILKDITTPIVKGDSKSLSIASASIMAKVTRDHIMNDLDKLYPNYGFAKHKGYGTQIHLDAIAKYGITEHHRKSFAPIRIYEG